MRLLKILSLIGAIALPAVAHAQSEPTLIETEISPDYSRGRNVSVTEIARPDYDALGIRRGGFLIYPRLSLGAGATSNVYLSQTDAVSDVFLSIAPSVNVRSDWSRHLLLAAAGLEYRPYISNGRRNELSYYLNLLARADVSSRLAVTGEAQAARVYESPFGGEVQSELAALSHYYRITGIGRVQFTSGRVRLTGIADYNNFEFGDINLRSGVIVDQSDRDRRVLRGVALGEYALSPSLSIYAQASLSDTGYERPLFNGDPNRSSSGFRILAGTTLDLSGFLRGSIGVGYTRRDFRAPIYRDVGGFSFDTKLEYFPTDLTTFTIIARRVLEDADLADTSAYFSSLASIRVDHELRRNILINLSAIYNRQNYIDSDRANDIYQIRGGGRYFLSHSLALRFDLAYTKSQQRGTVFGGDLSEVRGEIGIIFQL